MEKMLEMVRAEIEAIENNAEIEMAEADAMVNEVIERYGIRKMYGNDETMWEALGYEA